MARAAEADLALILAEGEGQGIEDTNTLRSRIHDIARNCDPPVPVTLRSHPQGVLEIHVAEGVQKPYHCRDGFFLRNGPNTQKLTRDEIVEIVLTKGRRRELHEYPQVAVREAVINAVMHRDYYYDLSHTYVHIHSNRLEVESPRGLPLGLQLEELGHRSVRRNRLVADFLFRAKYVERIGSGIRRMERALAENGNPPMEISASNFFVVRCYPLIAPAGTIDLTSRQSQLCRLLADRGALSKSDLADLLHVSGDTVLRDIKHLLHAGVIERRGTGRATRYVLAG